MAHVLWVQGFWFGVPWPQTLNLLTKAPLCSCIIVDAFNKLSSFSSILFSTTVIGTVGRRPTIKAKEVHTTFIVGCHAPHTLHFSFTTTATNGTDVTEINRATC